MSGCYQHAACCFACRRGILNVLCSRHARARPVSEETDVSELAACSKVIKERKQPQSFLFLAVPHASTVWQTLLLARFVPSMLQHLCYDATKAAALQLRGALVEDSRHVAAEHCTLLQCSNSMPQLSRPLRIFFMMPGRAAAKATLIFDSGFCTVAARRS